MILCRQFFVINLLGFLRINSHLICSLLFLANTFNRFLQIFIFHSRFCILFFRWFILLYFSLLQLWFLFLRRAYYFLGFWSWFIFLFFNTLARIVRLICRKRFFFLLSLRGLNARYYDRSIRFCLISAGFNRFDLRLRFSRAINRIHIEILNFYSFI
jgi:hypothetical protein